MMKNKTAEKSFILINTQKWLYILITGIIISLLVGLGDSESFASPGLKLLGIIKSPGGNYAVIKLRKNQELYREGDEVGNAFIKKISGKSVILNVSGTDEILTMDENKAMAQDKPGKPDGTSSQHMKFSDGFIPYPNLTKNYVQDALEDTGFLKDIRLRPHFRNGEPDGLSFSRIKPDSVFIKLGFRSRDILRSSDGQNIRSPEDALGFFKNLKASSDFRFQIRRGRRLITIHYKISDEKVSLTEEKQDTGNKQAKVSRFPDKDEKKSGTPDKSDKTPKNDKLSETDSQNTKHSKAVPFSELLRSHVQDALKDTSFIKGLKIRPHFRNGEPDGLSFSRIKLDSFFAKIGFRSGDILTSIDGQNITTADDALKFFKKLMAFSDFSFQIRHKGELITIHYEVSDEKILLTEENRQAITAKKPAKIIRSPESKKPLNQDIITPPHTSDQNLQATERFVNINFSNTDISVFIKFISDITGTKFTVSPRVKGKVNIAGSSKIPLKKAYEVLEAVLDIHGYTIADNNGVAEIIPSRKKRKIISDSVIEDIIQLFGPSDKNTGKTEQRLVSIDFSKTDMDSFIRAVSAITGRNFVISPRVKGKVTVISPSGISIDEVYKLFKIVLEIHNFTAVEAGAVTKIIRSDMRMRAIKRLIADSKPVIQKQSAVMKNSSHKASPSHKSENISIDFRNVNIGIYIRFISEITGKNVVLHPRLKGKITLFCPRKIPTDKIGILLNEIMGTGFFGFSAVDTSVATVIIPSSDPLIKVLQMSSAGYQENNTPTYEAAEKVSSQMPVPESGNEKELISIEFKNVNLDIFIRYISRLAYKNFVMASHNVCKKITLSSTDMSIEDTFKFFELTLKEHGLTSADADIVTKIIPTAGEKP
ncbi:MAG: hypothetical protein GY795_43970 [Desulfobacterales bacterium]|nr:hypothetical protein [Desulfobacterales bacterium]